jgi:hypothetical protein
MHLLACDCLRYLKIAGNTQFNVAVPSFDSPGARFDAGLRFDQAVAVPPVPPITHQRMPKFKLDLTKKTPAHKIALGAAHVMALPGGNAVLHVPAFTHDIALRITRQP